MTEHCLGGSQNPFCRQGCPDLLHFTRLGAEDVLHGARYWKNLQPEQRKFRWIPTPVFSCFFYSLTWFPVLHHFPKNVERWSMGYSISVLKCERNKHDKLASSSLSDVSYRRTGDSMIENGHLPQMTSRRDVSDQLLFCGN